MTLTIHLPPEAERKLQERASQTGQSVEVVVLKLIEEGLGANGPTPGQTLDEVLAPVREEFERSGMTDEDLAALVEETREKIWQEKQTRKDS